MAEFLALSPEISVSAEGRGKSDSFYEGHDKWNNENRNESNTHGVQKEESPDKACKSDSLKVNAGDVLGSAENDTEDKRREETIDITSPIRIDLTSSSTPLKRLSEDAESLAEKRRREEEESENLARQLMEEESINAYQLQIDYMRSNPELFSEEDMAALGVALQESENIPRSSTADEYDEREEDGSEMGDDSREWTYEQLLELGQTIGDVKTERWKMRSASVIMTLPRMTFKNFSELKKTNGAEQHCSVCMDVYEDNQDIILLPCNHYFHADCSEGWLKENNSCPLCKTKITNSP